MCYFAILVPIMTKMFPSHLVLLYYNIYYIFIIYYNIYNIIIIYYNISSRYMK